ncbi:MAG: Spy/CpxP family protein refolding chaperone [Deltaproteobacteria bacterium]|nr:Spy/CpxP family protein refolding chaperone [Deltaproteobacteria bacterium]
MKNAITILTTLGLSLSLLACGQRGMDADGQLMQQLVERRLNGMLDAIEASDAQRTQIVAVKDRMLGELHKMKAGHKQDIQLAVAEVRKDEPDREKLHRVLDARIDAHRAFAHQALDAVLDVHAVLTPAQRAAVLDKMEEMHAKRRGHFMRFRERFLQREIEGEK